MTATNNPAFAFVVNNLLNTNKNAKLLSKAKKESDILFANGDKKPDTNIQIVNDAGTVVEELVQSSATSKSNDKALVKKAVRVVKPRKSDLQSVCRVKPTALGRDVERKLNAVATKGVVQLFNVVKEQKKQIQTKLTSVGSSGQKRAKAMNEFSEDKFVKRVNEKRIENDPTKKFKKDENKKKASFLSENFNSSDKFKNWDVDSEPEENNDI